MHANTIGLDIAKSVFQVHGEDASGKIVIQKRLRRGQVAGFFAKLAPALVGIETCGTAHYWGRTLRALGHEVRLVPAAGACPRAGRGRTRGSSRLSSATRTMRAMRPRSAPRSGGPTCAFPTCALLQSKASTSRRRAGSSGRAS